MLVDRIKPKKQRKWALSQLGKLWRSHKAYLKKKCCKKGLKKKDVMGLHLAEVDF